ncbi:MAG TPA: methyl-accepting chemotaxis protein [Desulfobacteria bacterium]|nr:methyl-accepting chemotaxis protein [Desulfobacteria bacterium]
METDGFFNLKLKLRGKITGIFTVVTVIGLLAFSVLVVSLIRGEAARQITERVKADLSVGNILLEASYRGEWKVLDGKLYKGNIEINDNVILIDLIQKLTGDACSIYLGDTRITSTLKQGDQRIVGTKAPQGISQEVLQSGRNYYDMIDISGQNYYGAYIPLKDKKGEIVGMFEIAISDEQAQNAVHSGVFVKIFLVCGIIILAIILVSYVFATRISGQVNQLVTTMGMAEQGDLTRVAEVNTTDEIGDLAKSFNRMISNMRRLIDEVIKIGEVVFRTSKELANNAENATVATKQVARAMVEMAVSNTQEQTRIQETSEFINQLNESIRNIGNGAEAQANSVNDTASVMDRMAHSIEEVAALAQELHSATLQTTDVAHQGKQAVQKTMQEMERIKNSVFETAGRIQALGEQSNQIGQIIQVIDDIAGQTNLLALNAAIEAARAGEHGKGFAVVADEVRKLAERSSHATKEIADLITTIQTGTGNAVQAMQKDTTEVEIGFRLAQDASQALENIISMIDRAAEQIKIISTAAEQMSSNSELAVNSVGAVAAITTESLASTEEMTANSEQVVGAIQAIFSLAEQSATTANGVSDSAGHLTVSSEEVASYANELADLSEKLKNSISFFKIK